MTDKKTIKVSDLTGAALDWAVAKCESVPEYILNKPYRASELIEAYSTDWAQGGPIIERECIGLGFGVGINSDQWEAGYKYNPEETGATPLIAALRCYVASKLGGTVEVPEDLIYD